jgi:hypothetical protein
MSEINQKDVESFAKVLITLGETIKDNPDLVLEILKAPKKKTAKKPSKQSTNSNKPSDSSELYEFVKVEGKKTLIQALKLCNVERLRELIKDLQFSSHSSKEVGTLAEYIADQLEKRTRDVFKNQ